MDWKEVYLACKAAVVDSQKEDFPYHLDPSLTYGLTIDIFPGVYSTKYFTAWKFYLPYLRDVRGDVLEVGCGHGLASLFMAKTAEHVVAVDISEPAIETTRHNAHINNIRNVDVRKSDVFSAIKNDEKFDLIFWNMPWGYAPDDFTDLTLLERANINPGYRSIKTFLEQAPRYLKEKGKVRIVIGSDSANVPLIEEWLGNYAWKVLGTGHDATDPAPDFQIIELQVKSPSVPVHPTCRR